MSELKTYDFPVDHRDFTATVELFYFKSEPKSVRNTACEFCPIKGTELCHKINPNAPKYTRWEKKELAEKFKEEK